MLSPEFLEFTEYERRDSMMDFNQRLFSSAKSYLYIFIVGLSITGAVTFVENTATASTKHIDHDTLLNAIWVGKITSETHVFYHHDKAKKYGVLDNKARVGAYIVALFSLVGPLLVASLKVKYQKKCAMIWTILGAVALVLVFIPVVYRFDYKYWQHTKVATDWTVHLNEWKSLSTIEEGLDPRVLEEKIGNLLAEKKRIEQIEASTLPGVDIDLLGKWQKKVTAKYEKESGASAN